MRKIRGWIRNLADGLGPPPGSVEVHARPPDNTELDLEDHELGALSVVHLAGGSSSTTEADAIGHFGWDMELSPGPIITQVIPSDPQTEYRWRFPDESAQVGRSFHSDIERMGWAAGRDCLIWDAIEGGDRPTAATWSADPAVSAAMGNWGIAGYGSGADAGRVTLRRGIAFLGGVLFSVEMGDLVAPVAGADAGVANGTGSDRWDLLVMATDVNPLSTEYGKQSFLLQQGVPGSGIPALVEVSGSRRMAIHALKMAAGASVYSAAWDLRRWSVPPPLAGAGYQVSRLYEDTGSQRPAGIVDSLLNTTMASDEILLPPMGRWTGSVTWTGTVAGSSQAGTLLSLLLSTEGRGPDTTVVAGSDDYVIRAPEIAVGLGVIGGWVEWELTVETVGERASFTWPLRIIPSYLDGRTWSRLRFALKISCNDSGIIVADQYLTASLWPVP